MTDSTVEDQEALSGSVGSGDLRRRNRSILEMTCAEARTFLLKPESYTDIDLPQYFSFDELITDVTSELNGTSLPSLSKGSPKAWKLENVNHKILHNKDGRYAWRPVELIHPALYVSLVSQITDPGNWCLITERFEKFQHDSQIRCLSLPVESSTEEKDRAELVAHWWREVEQESIQAALDFRVITHTDLVDCYGAIYTHSIPWALHTRAVAKAKRGKNQLVGNQIDCTLRDMRNGQTNGVPQGSTLSDFIAEIVLGYSDLNLSRRIRKVGIDDFRILRYRDDYKILTNSSEDATKILKALTEVMIELGLRLNPSKTESSSDVVSSSIKKDKLDWICRKQYHESLQGHLLIIHNLSTKYPNSGSVRKALTSLNGRLSTFTDSPYTATLVSIVTDIAVRSPRAQPICAAILSKLLNTLESNDERCTLVERMRKKFSWAPNAGHMEVWLQRITWPFAPTIEYEEPLCQLVNGNSPIIWNSDWISSKTLQAAVDPEQIIDRDVLGDLKPIVTDQEIELFRSRTEAYW